jgi:anti-sigma regulatory factor (Ser/Thr protein kinase)
MVSRARSLIDQYRNQTAKALIDRARTAAAHLLNPPPPVRPRHALTRPPLDQADTRTAGPIADQDALAGVCANLALRDLNLVDSLLAQLERMEAAEEDPDTLAQLYGLDHLATRLRRNAENLRVLAGQEAGGAAEETATLLDVIRAALSSIEHYPRVEIGRVAALAVVGFAADDISRLLAELLDNATVQSPPTSAVTVSAHLTERGSVLLRVEDAGIGLPEQRQRELNEWLDSAPVLDGSAIEHMGLAVVRRLAQKHGVRVSLGRRAPHGTTAAVLLPPDLVREAPPTTFTRRPPSAPEPTVTPDEPTTTVSGLPRRTAAAGTTLTGTARTSTARIAATRLDERPQVPATTPSGLPRRQPRSLRDGTRPAAEPAGDTAVDTAADTRSDTTGDVTADTVAEAGTGGRQFVADLAAFAEGEQQARTGHLANPADPARDDQEGGHDDE